jgi:hypothetical protein
MQRHAKIGATPTRELAKKNTPARHACSMQRHAKIGATAKKPKPQGSRSRNLIPQAWLC